LSSSFNPISSGIFAFSKLDCARGRLAVTNNNYQKISYVHHGMIIKYKEHLGYSIIVFQNNWSCSWQ
jgi:hypothetical protein